MQVLNVVDVSADHSSVEESRKVKIERKAVPVLEILAADDIGRESSQKKTEERSDHRNKNCDAVGPDNPLRSLENQLVGLNGEFARPEAESMKADPLLRCEGARDKQDERDKADQR